MENTLVNLKFHVKGKFDGKPPFLRYLGSEVQEIGGIDTDYLSSIELRVLLEETFGFQDVDKIHYKVPNKPLSDGLCLIHDDNDIRSMLASCGGFGTIELYVEYNRNVNQIAQENVDKLPISIEANQQNEAPNQVENKDLDEDEGYNLIGVGYPSEYEAESTDELDDERMIQSNMLKEAVNEENDDNSSVFSFSSSECGSFISTGDESDAEHAIRVPSRFPSYNPKSETPYFEVGLTFAGREQFKDAITKYSIKAYKSIRLEKNDKTRVRAVCKGKNYPWYILASYDKPSNHFMVKTYVNDHTCSRNFKNSRITSVFLANKYASRIRSNPTWKLREFKEAVKEDLGVDVHETKCMRAKTIVLRKLEGCYKDDYKRIWDYKEELKSSNPHNTVEIKVDTSFPDGLPIFRRMYVCLDALKKGFLVGCRKFVGLDGCFLKGMIKGEVLTAVAKDGNDQIYPIAWAIVEVENKDSREWFLLLLKDDLAMGNGEGWTIISDQQKGLIPSIAELLLDAEQRMCARHIYANWRKNYPNKSYQLLFWNCAKATTREQFKRQLDILVDATGSPTADIMKVDPQFWCSAWFSGQSKCDSCDNNCCESFNKELVEARINELK